ncbi:MAG: hypothetical protein LH472_10110 [Pyrinomonadaceae bacterium]|nr:hypothetical protein [Pyrinomonadaceae bacterium]
MPITASKSTGGTTYASPFVGNIDHFVSVRIDISALTSREVDAAGHLKPGATFNLATGLLPTAAGQKVGVTHEPIKLGATLALVQANTNDPFVALGVIGVLNRDIMEDNLGSAVSANEIAALDGAGSRLVLGLT